MNKIILGFCFAFTISIYTAQNTIVDSIYVGGIYRTYRLYVPTIYTGATARPLILNLHGYTSNALQQQQYSNFKPIADTANFLMVYPQGTKDGSNQPYWNAGFSSTQVNDIAFLSALIDSLDLSYNINLNRVYSTGMSNGGFMSHTLACELSNRITAIASVTGGIFTTQYGSNCHPTRPVPVMQIHGTSDNTVPYAGNMSQGMMPIDSVVKYWVKKNNCNPTPTFSNVPNTNTADGCTAEHYKYSGGNLGSTVELYKIIGGGHTWPGFPFGGVGTNMDINASKEIWRFFSKYNLASLTSVDENETFSKSLTLYPNPANSILNFKSENESNFSIEITDILGKIVLSELNITHSVSIASFTTGIYFVSVKTDRGAVAKLKFIKE
ncbi:MAG: T9SS type A sorting domain-containing protein [Burkholderiales bacterium]|nr:T9SS type A sorting domain-containing protein [Bacteroidia bacterium]